MGQEFKALSIRHNQINNKSICQTIFHHREARLVYTRWVSDSQKIKDFCSLLTSAKCHNRLAMMSLCFLAWWKIVMAALDLLFLFMCLNKKLANVKDERNQSYITYAPELILFTVIMKNVSGIVSMNKKQQEIYFLNIQKIKREVKRI